MEQQIIPISKANVQATSAETTLLAAANPKLGRFDPYTIPSQIDLPSTLINRFDLIFPVRDILVLKKMKRLLFTFLILLTKKKLTRQISLLNFMKYMLMPSRR